jgi:hypothetical protein
MIDEMKQQYKGTTLPKLIEHHIKKQTEKQLQEAVFETYSNFSDDVAEEIDDYTMDYLKNWFSPDIVSKDLSKVFEEAITSIENISLKKNWMLTEAQKVDVFVIKVLRISFFAASKPEFRKKLGVRKGWFS